MSAQLTALIDTSSGKVLGYDIYGPGPRTPFAGGKLEKGLAQAVIASYSLGGSFSDDVDDMARTMLREPRYANIVAFMRADGTWKYDADPKPGLYECTYTGPCGVTYACLCAVFIDPDGSAVLHFKDGVAVPWEGFRSRVTKMRRCTPPVADVVPF